MKKIHMLFFNFLVLLFSCNDKPGEKHYSIKVTDNTVLGINCCYQSIYPDTSLPILKPTMTVVSSNTFSEIKSQVNWEQLFSEAPQNKISFFIFSGDTLNYYPWSLVQSGYKILKRYDLTVEDMKANNFSITYP